jgi:hypothetical protein
METTPATTATSSSTASPPFGKNIRTVREPVPYNRTVRAAVAEAQPRKTKAEKVTKDGSAEYYRDLLLQEFDDVVDKLPNELPPLRD